MLLTLGLGVVQEELVTVVTVPQPGVLLLGPLPQLFHPPLFADEVAGFVEDALEMTVFEVVATQVPQF